MYSLLQELCEIIAPTNNESPVQIYLTKRWLPRANKLWRTPVGNLIAHIGGKGPRLLIEGHADEIGLIVNRIAPNGLLGCTTIQRSAVKMTTRFMRVLVGKPGVAVGTKGHIPLVFVAQGHALVETNVPKWEDTYADLGATSAEQVRSLGLNIGTLLAWQVPTRRFGSLIYGKAMDDRAALAVMTALLEEIEISKLRYDLYLASTVMEETGLLGGADLALSANFDRAIALEAGMAGDYPGVQWSHVPARLGGGPLLVHKDASAHFDPQLIHELQAAARAANVPVQNIVFPGGFRGDGAALFKHGIPTAQIAFPCRYTHSPGEMVHEDDLANSVKWLKTFLTG